MTTYTSVVVRKLTDERDSARAELAELKVVEAKLKAAAASVDRMRDITQKFYELVVKERDYERTRCLRVETELEQARAEIVALQEAATSTTRKLDRIREVLTDRTIEVEYLPESLYEILGPE